MDYLTSESPLNGKEEVIYRAGEGVVLEAGINQFGSTPRCANCRGSEQSKRLPIHSYVDKKGKIHFRCNKNSICECACRTHYIGRDGKLRPYGTKDDSFSEPPKPKPDYTNIDRILAGINKSTEAPEE